MQKLMIWGALAVMVFLVVKEAATPREEANASTGGALAAQNNPTPVVEPETNEP